MMKIPVGISACLIGEKVRYDGAHQRSKLCSVELAEYFDYCKICPEVAIGLGVPRDTIRVVNTDSKLGVYNSSGLNNYQPALSSFANETLVNRPDLCGFIVMKGSPSCGMVRVKQYTAAGDLHDRRGVGAFTRQLLKANPLLPIEDSERLNDVQRKENFVLRVCALHDWKTNVAAVATLEALLAYHSRYQTVVKAHKPQAYKALTQLVAARKQIDLKTRLNDYIRLFMAALAKPTSRKKHAKVLFHLLQLKAQHHVLQDNGAPR